MAGLDEIAKAIAKAQIAVKELDYEAEEISGKEFRDYMVGGTVSGDKYTLRDVLSNPYLMAHEVVEVSELKRSGVRIDSRTVRRLGLARQMYEAHLKAAEYELELALRDKETSWIRSRLRDMQVWLKDEHLPKQLVPRCRDLVDRLATSIPSAKGDVSEP